MKAMRCSGCNLIEAKVNAHRATSMLLNDIKLKKWRIIETNYVGDNLQKLVMAIFDMSISTLKHPNDVANFKSPTVTVW